MKSKRQQFWKEKRYTSEQIENHLSWEREKGKEARERKKRNNEKNIKLIKQIKTDLLGKTFDNKTILRISETNDGKGFWFKCHTKFNDGSEGDFRYFYHFDDYVFEDFIEFLKL